MDAAFAAGRIKQIRHLAGQRLADLLKLSEDIPGSAKRLQAFSKTLSHWQTIETKRQFFAHGTVILGSNTNGWIALFDTVDYRGKERTEQRWAVTEAEATEFTDELKHAFECLGGQLGHFRKRLDTA
ncbi:hypothetical protein [Qipengyuania sp. 902]|uniref:hypothetical protein n=1 Tax=Qipengyuania sp. 902 TaxID=3417565 RepID=UPI003EB8ADBD